MLQNQMKCVDQKENSDHEKFFMKEKNGNMTYLT